MNYKDHQARNVKVYKRNVEDILFLQDRNDIYVQRVGESVIRVMHQRVERPVTYQELVDYKNQRSEYIKSSLWLRCRRNSAAISPIKRYVKKYDSYENVNFKLN